jgi:hypothetical protein
MKTKKTETTTTTTTAAGTAAPAPAPATKAVKHHSLLNKAQLAEISHTNTIYGVASDPAVFAVIQDNLILTPAFMTQLGADLEGMSQYTGGASQAALDSQDDTKDEAAAEADLLAKVHYIQSKAKIKYPANHPARAEYGIGNKLPGNRPLLEATAGNIFNKLKSDTLPKIAAQHSTDLDASLKAYQKTKVDQKAGKGDAVTLRQKLADMVDSLAARRRQLQHATDGEYPYTDPANAGMRLKFDLPPNQPLAQ